MRNKERNKKKGMKSGSLRKHKNCRDKKKRRNTNSSSGSKKKQRTREESTKNSKYWLSNWSKQSRKRLLNRQSAMRLLLTKMKSRLLMKGDKLIME